MILLEMILISLGAVIFWLFLASTEIRREQQFKAPSKPKRSYDYQTLLRPYIYKQK